MTHPSRYELEQFFSGDSGATDYAGEKNIAQHVAQCSQCGEMVQTMQLAQQQLLQQESAREFISRISTPSERERTDVRWGGLWGIRLPALVGALAAVLVLCMAGGIFFLQEKAVAPASVSDNAVMRWKGGAPVVEVFVNRNERITALGDEPILPGDGVQYRVSLPNGATGFAALIALENGRLETVFPKEANGRPIRIDGTGELPESIWIDENSTDLSLFLVLQNQPFQLNQLLSVMNASLAKRGRVQNVPGLVNVQSMRDKRANAAAGTDN